MTTTTTAQNNPPTTATPETAQATFISIVADASGSMNHLHGTVIKGLNDFIAEQASSDNDAKVTIVQFPSLKDEDGIQTILPKSNVKTARKITGKDYVINGMTPLYDAIGAVITKADERIAKRVAKGKDPESQVVVIFTDGGENASRKFTQDAIFTLIAERKAQGWVFVFLGANQDAFEADDDDTRKIALTAHVQSMRNHIQTLGAKSYQSQFEEAPDYVLMFVPGEHFLAAALDRHQPRVAKPQIREFRLVQAERHHRHQGRAEAPGFHRRRPAHRAGAPL